MKLTQKHIKVFLLILTVLASIKMLLQNFSLDEEYQVLMSYRQLMGDGMFGTMWEPHQTCSFLCTIFMWPYHRILGTWTGVVIYLRLIGTLIHLGVAIYLYKVLRHFLEETPAFYLALIFFNTVPKLIMLPEFGGMQVWFGVLCFLAIIDSVEDITFTGLGSARLRMWGKLVFAALWLCLEVLSYPSCALLYVPFVLMIWTFHGEQRFRKCLVFTLSCGVVGIAYAGYFLVKLSPEVFFRNVEAILSSDLTHTFNTGSKLAALGGNLLYYLAAFGGLTLLSWAATQVLYSKKFGATDFGASLQVKLPAQRSLTLVGILILLSNLYQLVLWVFQNKGYEYMQIHLALTLCLGLWLVAFGLRSRDTFAKYMWFGALIGALSLACIMMLTDLDLLSSVPHAMLGSLCMLALFVHLCGSNPGFAYVILTAFCLTACIGKGYTLRDGFGDYNNVLQSRGICKYGPAIGTISNYMGAYIYNNEYLLWQDSIPEGSKVMIATANVQSVNTIQYLFREAEVCHYSIVDPTAYDERLLTYWSYYPDKQPDIIVIDCWFGNMLFAEDSWIVQYIEQDFGYSEMIEGDYVRIYKK